MKGACPPVPGAPGAGLRVSGAARLGAAGMVPPRRPSSGERPHACPPPGPCLRGCTSCRSRLQCSLTCRPSAVIAGAPSAELPTVVSPHRGQASRSKQAPGGAAAAEKLEQLLVILCLYFWQLPVLVYVSGRTEQTSGPSVRSCVSGDFIASGLPGVPGPRERSQSPLL